MLTIPYDVDQAEWQSQMRYADGTLHPWRPDKTVIHWGGGPNGAGDAIDQNLEMQVLRGWQNWHINAFVFGN